MSTIETTDVAVERVTFVRSFELPLADAWDGRTLDVRVVPYNVPTTVADPPRFTPYRESFLRGAFEKQLTTPGRDRVWLNVEHEQGFRGAIGRSLKFSDHEDGLHGSFGVLENADGDKALSLIRDGFLTGLSLEFKALASRRLNGVVERVRAQLDAVSLCRFPAYAGAEVLAVREEPEEELVEEEAVAVELVRSSDVDERLAALGFEALEGGMTEAELADAARALTRGRRNPERAAEARKLIRYYNQAGLDAPTSLRALGGSA
jgi:Escherichia/Staphylococcus phage prohead protease